MNEINQISQISEEQLTGDIIDHLEGKLEDLKAILRRERKVIDMRVIDEINKISDNSANSMEANFVKSAKINEGNTRIISQQLTQSTDEIRDDIKELKESIAAIPIGPAPVPVPQIFPIEQLQAKVKIRKKAFEEGSFINDEVRQIVSESEDLLSSNSEEMTQEKINLVEKNIIFMDDIIERRKEFLLIQETAKNREDLITVLQDNQVKILSSMDKQGEDKCTTAQKLDSNEAIRKEELSSQLNEVCQAVSSQTYSIKEQIILLSNDIQSVALAPQSTNAKIDEIATAIYSQIPDEGRVIIDTIRRDLCQVKDGNIDQYLSICEKLSEIYDAIVHNGLNTLIEMMNKDMDKSLIIQSDTNTLANQIEKKFDTLIGLVNTDHPTIQHLTPLLNNLRDIIEKVDGKISSELNTQLTDLKSHFSVQNEEDTDDIRNLFEEYKARIVELQTDITAAVHQHEEEQERNAIISGELREAAQLELKMSNDILSQMNQLKEQSEQYETDMMNRLDEIANNLASDKQTEETITQTRIMLGNTIDHLETTLSGKFKTELIDLRDHLKVDSQEEVNDTIERNRAVFMQIRENLEKHLKDCVVSENKRLEDELRVLIKDYDSPLDQIKAIILEGQTKSMMEIKDLRILTKVVDVRSISNKEEIIASQKNLQIETNSTIENTHQEAMEGIKTLTSNIDGLEKVIIELNDKPDKMLESITLEHQLISQKLNETQHFLDNQVKDIIGDIDEAVNMAKMIITKLDNNNWLDTNVLHADLEELIPVLLDLRDMEIGHNVSSFKRVLTGLQRIWSEILVKEGKTLWAYLNTKSLILIVENIMNLAEVQTVIMQRKLDELKEQNTTTHEEIEKIQDVLDESALKENLDDITGNVGDVKKAALAIQDDI
jgi:hypothetical protein